MEPIIEFTNFPNVQFNVVLSRWNHVRTSSRSIAFAKELNEVNKNITSGRQFDVQTGEPVFSSSVAKRAEDVKASLIVVSDDPRLRNSVLNLVHEAPCPVLAVPNPASKAS